MSCDSFHGLVEKRMRKAKNAFTFKDFSNIIEQAGGTPKVISMEFGDFRLWDRRVTGGKIIAVPKLGDLWLNSKETQNC